MSGRHSRRRAFVPGLVAACAAAALVAAAAPAAGAASVHRTAVIVEADTTSQAAQAVAIAGGAVELQLPLVDGVSASVDDATLATLEQDASVRVVPDVELHPTGLSVHAAGSSSSAAGPGIDPQLAALDPGAGWSPDAGRGVGVALVDTGVADSPDLHAPRLVRGADFSGEGDGIDHYGHGTFMAGLIAGDGTASAHSATPHYGVAPGATLVSVKVAGADGTTTTSRVIAGIGWVVTHRDTYDIGVLNLSFGVDTPLPYFVDPLSGAVEAAWASGITVVTAAGNEGRDHVTSPGSDPYVLTVGAVDTTATGGHADDAVPGWSGRERFPGYSKPDVLAPGVSVVSLRAPGSTIDTGHPEGRVDATYFRGTGTSMSTAMVSGAAAILLSRHAHATPDDVKGAIVDSAAKVNGPNAHGAGELDLDRADRAPAQADWWQHFPLAFGGAGFGFGLRVGMPWTASRWTTAFWAASRWTASRWTDAFWAASRWTASRWTAEAWSASRWTASRWTASRWTAEAWPSEGWG